MDQDARFRERAWGARTVAVCHPNSPATPWEGSPARPLCQKICYSDCTENCPLRPCEHNLQAPLFSGTWSARTRPEPTQGSWVGLIFQGDIQGISGSICESISGAAPSSLLPTGHENILVMTDSRSGRSSFDSKLISLLPLDEFPFTSTASPPTSPPTSPPAPLAIRKAPSASVESIEPRPPRPCEVGRPKGRRRKSRRQSHRLFFSTCCAWHPNSPPRPGEAPHPAPSARKSVIRLHRKLPSAPPCEHPGGFGILKSASNWGHSPLRGSG